MKPSLISRVQIAIRDDAIAQSQQPKQAPKPPVAKS